MTNSDRIKEFEQKIRNDLLENDYWDPALVPFQVDDNTLILFENYDTNVPQHFEYATDRFYSYEEAYLHLVAHKHWVLLQGIYPRLYFIRYSKNPLRNGFWILTDKQLHEAVKIIYNFAPFILEYTDLTYGS